MKNKYDIIIVGTGVAGCFTALHLPDDMDILMITKGDLEESDSFLAQGGICVLKDEDDYDSFFEDTMRAGHYETVSYTHLDVYKRQIKFSSPKIPSNITFT